MAEKETRKHAGLLPKVTFGLGVAVLTGAAVVTVGPGARTVGAEHVMTTPALGAVINDAGSGFPPGITTCCGNT